MNAGEMSDGTPVSPKLDAQMLADLRAWRARLTPSSTGGSRWSARLTIDELDMLLRVAAERDAFKAAACAAPEDADAPAYFPQVRIVDLPAGHALIAGEVVPLPGGDIA